MVLIKQNSLFTPIPYPHNFAIHAIPYFLLGIICGPKWGSFAVRDHLRFNLGIICGPGSFAVPGLFAEPYLCNLSGKQQSKNNDPPSMSNTHLFKSWLQNSSGATRTSRTSREIRVTICTIRSSGSYFR